MHFDVFAITRVAPGTNTSCQRIGNPGIQGQTRIVERERDASPLGHLPRVPEQPEAGDVGDRVHSSAMLLEGFGRCTIEATHAGNYLSLVGSVTSSKRYCGTQWLGDHEYIAGNGTSLAENLVGVNKSLHSKAKDWFRIANRVPAGNGTAGFGHNGCSGFKDCRDRLAWEVLGERSDIDSDGDSPTHRKYVAARVRRRDRSEVTGMVHQRREEVGGAHHCEVVGDLVHGCIIERGESHDERGIAGDGKFADEAREQRRAPLRGATAARRPFGEADTVEICHVGQPTVGVMISLGPYTFTTTDALRTLGNLNGLWTEMMRGRHSTAADAIGDALTKRLAAALGARPGATLAELSLLGAKLPARSPVLASCLDDVWRCLAEACDVLRADGQLPATAEGLVTQLSSSSGGVPKIAIGAVDVDFGGVIGDVQGSRAHHGRPWQALCLYADELIDAFRTDDHPIARGCAGENITVAGIDWSLVRPGVRLRIGTVLADVQAYAVPCHHNAQWFNDGDFNRMSSTRGPVSRVYATVREPGRIVTGDAIVLEP